MYNFRKNDKKPNKKNNGDELVTDKKKNCPMFYGNSSVY